MASLDPLWDNVALLIHGDGAHGSSYIYDEYGNPYTPFGAVALSSPQPLFGSACLDLTLSTGGHWYSARNPNMTLNNATDATIEFAVKLPSYNGGYGTIMRYGTDNTSDLYNWGIWLDTTDIKFTVTNGTTEELVVAVPHGLGSQLDEWHRFAFEKTGNTVVVLKDGSPLGSGTITLTIGYAGPTDGAGHRILLVGANRNWYNSTSRNDGARVFLDELRITVGQNRGYASGYSPATAAFPGRDTNIVPADVNTLIHFDGTGGSSAITDYTGNPWTSTGATLDGTTKKYGSASGDISVGNWTRTSGASITGDVSISFWVNFQDLTTDRAQRIIDNSSGGYYILFNVLPRRFTVHLNTYGIDVTVPTLVINRWWHIAVQRVGPHTSVFVDGVNTNTSNYTVSTALNDVITNNRVGYTGGNIDCLIDELLITNRAVFPQSGFDPPIGPYLSKKIVGNVSNELGPLERTVYLIDKLQSRMTSVVSDASGDYEIQNLHDGPFLVAVSGESPSENALVFDHVYPTTV